MDITASGNAKLGDLTFDCDLEIYVHRFQGAIASVSIELQPLPVDSGISLEGACSTAKQVSFSGVVYNFGHVCGLRPMPFFRTGDRLIGQIEPGKQLNDYFYLIAKD